MCLLHYFSTLALRVLSKVVDQSHCGASGSNAEITDIFSDAIFTESLDDLVMVLEKQDEEAKPLGL